MYAVFAVIMSPFWWFHMKQFQQTEVRHMTLCMTFERQGKKLQNFRQNYGIIISDSLLFCIFYIL